MISIVIALYIAIGLYEIAPLIKEKQYRELWLYGSFLGTAFLVSILLSLNVKIPSPAKAIEAMVEMIVKN